jgi:hypothetical protein
MSRRAARCWSRRGRSSGRRQHLPLAAGRILPGEPTARVVEEGYLPRVTGLGHRHPVTEGLAPDGDDATPTWGRWFRLVELTPRGGQEVMSGPGDRPLLMLDRVGEGRVALLASDHAWLWGAGSKAAGRSWNCCAGWRTG